MQRCTFCGNKEDTGTKVVQGYIILDTCETCEEEILEN